MEITLFIDAPAEYFSGWLKEYTSNVVYRYTFPTEKGRISLERARGISNGTPIRISMDGMYIVPEDENSEVGYTLHEVILFKLVPLTPNRIEIEAKCSQPVVMGYFLLLLTEIEKRWPQPKDVSIQLNDLRGSLESNLTEIKAGQSAILSTVVTTDSKLKKIQEAIEQGRIEQGEIALALDAIRRVLLFVQKNKTIFDATIVKEVDNAQNLIESSLSVEQKVELTIPILPAFLNYKIELTNASEVDINTLRNFVQSVLQTAATSVTSKSS